MKEIHAIQNDDGTYRVEIFGRTVARKHVGAIRTEDTTECSAVVPRATIHICALSGPTDDKQELLTFEIKE